MKNVKKLSLLLVFSLLIFCFSGVSIFAADDVAEKEFFVIDTDILFASVPEDYEFDPYGGAEYTTYNFADEDCNTVSFMVFENNEMPQGIRNVTDQQAIEFAEKNYADYWEYVLDKITVKKSVVNGISALKIDGSSCYAEDFGIEEYYFGFSAYILATRENIFLIVFDSCEQTADQGVIKSVMASLLVNGTYFEGDKLNATHDFSNALTFEEALARDVEVFDSTGINAVLNGMSEDFIPIILIIVGLIYIVPTLVIIILAIVFGVKYNKNKKQLQEYELRFGNFNGFNYNMGNPMNTQAYSQTQMPSYMGNINQTVNPGAYANQAYNTPGATVYGNNGGFAQPQNNPVPPVNMPVPPVNNPVQPVNTPSSAVNTEANPQTVNNLAPELQDSKADENKQ